MIGMIVLYIKIFRVLHGQMSKLLVWLTEIKTTNGRRTSQTIVFDPLTTTGNENGAGRGAASTASSTSNFHQQTARCSIVGSINNINYLHHHRLMNTYSGMRNMKNLPPQLDPSKYRLTQTQDNPPATPDALASPASTTTTHKFRRAVHAIVWLGRTRESVGTHKGSFKEYRENSQARTNKKLFYTSGWSTSNNGNHIRCSRNSTYRQIGRAHV